MTILIIILSITILTLIYSLVILLILIFRLMYYRFLSNNEEIRVKCKVRHHNLSIIIDNPRLYIAYQKKFSIPIQTIEASHFIKLLEEDATKKNLQEKLKTFTYKETISNFCVLLQVYLIHNKKKDNVNLLHVLETIINAYKETRNTTHKELLNARYIKEIITAEDFDRFEETIHLWHNNIEKLIIPTIQVYWKDQPNTLQYVEMFSTIYHKEAFQYYVLRLQIKEIILANYYNTKHIFLTLKNTIYAIFAHATNARGFTILETWWFSAHFCKKILKFETPDYEQIVMMEILNLEKITFNNETEIENYCQKLLNTIIFKYNNENQKYKEKIYDCKLIIGFTVTGPTVSQAYWTRKRAQNVLSQGGIIIEDETFLEHNFKQITETDNYSYFIIEPLKHLKTIQPKSCQYILTKKPIKYLDTLKSDREDGILQQTPLDMSYCAPRQTKTQFIISNMRFTTERKYPITYKDGTTFPINKLIEKYDNYTK